MRLKAKNQAARTRAEALKQNDAKAKIVSEIFHKQKVIEEMSVVAENVNEKIVASMEAVEGASKGRKTAANKQIIEGETRKLQALEIYAYDFRGLRGSLQTAPAPVKKRIKPRPKWLKLTCAL